MRLCYQVRTVMLHNLLLKLADVLARDCATDGQSVRCDLRGLVTMNIMTMISVTVNIR